MENEIVIVILDDGQIRAETGSFSEAVHGVADRLMNRIEELLGGKRTITSNKHSEGHHPHVHEHKVEQK